MVKLELNEQYIVNFIINSVICFLHINAIQIKVFF